MHAAFLDRVRVFSNLIHLPENKRIGVRPYTSSSMRDASRYGLGPSESGTTVPIRGGSISGRSFVGRNFGPPKHLFALA
jgi:hypothetical protein